MDLVTINVFVQEKINQAPYPIIYKALTFPSTSCLGAFPLNYVWLYYLQVNLKRINLSCQKCTYTVERCYLGRLLRCLEKLHFQIHSKLICIINRTLDQKWIKKKSFSRLKSFKKIVFSHLYIYIYIFFYSLSCLYRKLHSK